MGKRLTKCVTLFALMTLATSTHGAAPAAATRPGEPVEFDKLWDYAKPAETEGQFRALLPSAEASGDTSYLAQLLTQIGRAQGLQDRFDEAHATLDRVTTMLTDDMNLARVRYLLERGRVFN